MQHRWIEEYGILKPWIMQHWHHFIKALHHSNTNKKNISHNQKHSAASISFWHLLPWNKWMHLRKHVDTDLSKKNNNNNNYKQQEKCKPSSINIHHNLFEVINKLKSSSFQKPNVLLVLLLFTIFAFSHNFSTKYKTKTELQLYSTQNDLV